MYIIVMVFRWLIVLDFNIKPFFHRQKDCFNLEFTGQFDDTVFFIAVWLKIRGNFMVHSFKIEATKISFKKLDILIEQFIFLITYRKVNGLQKKLQLQSVFYPCVLSSLKVTEIQIVFSISSHGQKRKPTLSAELLHRQFTY